MKTNTSKLTGGKRGWSAALSAAYYGNGRDMHSPCIRYSHERGFFVESSYIPAEANVVMESRVRYHPSGKKFHRHSDYGKIRSVILSNTVITS